MRFLRQSMIGLFLASLTLGLLVYAFQLVSGAIQDSLAERPSPPVRERVFTVDVIPAVAGSEVPVLEAFGEVDARRRLELRAAVGGRVVHLSPAFEDGGVVRAGDVLLRIDDADLQAEVERLGADLADAEAEVRDAASSLDLAREDRSAAETQAGLRAQALTRQQDLLERGVGSAASVETAELASAAAEAVVIARRQAVAQAEVRIDLAATRLSRARIALDEAQRDLEDTQLMAPFAGTLGETSVVEGGLVSANERLAVLIDAEDLEVSFRVSTTQYARLLSPEGALIPLSVTVTLDAADADLQATGRISRVDAATGEGQTGRLVFGRLDAAPGFRPGDFVTVRVEEPEVRDVVRLPASALASSGAVLVLTGEDRLEALPVTLVRRQGDDVLVRGDGLDGREVVRQVTPLLGEGIAVRPVRRGAQQTRIVPDLPELLELSDERRARLMAFVREDSAMAEDARARVLARLAEPQVPAQIVANIESRMGG